MQAIIYLDEFNPYIELDGNRENIHYPTNEQLELLTQRLISQGYSVSVIDETRNEGM